MNAPWICIDYTNKRYAVFDELTRVSGFRPYQDEQEAIRTARAEIARRTDKEPEIVYSSVSHFWRLTNSGAGV